LATPTGVGTPADQITPELLDLIRAAARAKHATAQLYAAWEERAPGGVGRMVTALARDEQAHAELLDRLLAELSGRPAEPVMVAGVGCGLHDEQWPSALISAFALDQAITAAMISLSRSPHPQLSATAQRIVDEEGPHQRFAVDAFRVFANQDVALGRRLALEMLDARNWVQQIFPRRKALGALAEAGVLPDDAPRAHDSFLASLGDKVQDALGVLGEL
jgi:1,2-phenylacetyl-CoA epoxidase catalytic subunit